MRNTLVSHRLGTSQTGKTVDQCRLDLDLASEPRARGYTSPFVRSMPVMRTYAYIYPALRGLLNPSRASLFQLEARASNVRYPTGTVHHNANRLDRRHRSRSVQFAPSYAPCRAKLTPSTTNLNSNTAGLGIYRAALADPSIQRVTLLTRRPIPAWAELPSNASEKTDVVLHDDFGTYPADLAKRVAEHDALIWALGKSAMGMSREAYTELTYEYTMAAARALKDAGAGTPERPFRLVWISGELASPEGTSLQMWANVKVREPDRVFLKGINWNSAHRTWTGNRAAWSASCPDCWRARTSACTSSARATSFRRGRTRRTGCTSGARPSVSSTRSRRRSGRGSSRRTTRGWKTWVGLRSKSRRGAGRIRSCSGIRR